MLIAYNNDIEFRSRWYHIQTEDNGIKDGHITTTVFISGQILESKSISYKDAIEGKSNAEEQNAIIKDMMVKQHQKFYQKLYSGSYEEQVNDIMNRPKGNAQSGPGTSVPPIPATSAAATSANPSLSRPASVALQPPRSAAVPAIAIKKSKPESLIPPLSHSTFNAKAVAAPPKAVAPPVVSRAVLNFQATRKTLAYSGFEWPSEDLAIDILAAEYLESAKAS